MDLVTFGEAMMRLSPPAGQRIEETHSFDTYVGGAELNVAVAGRHLGLKARWVSRLPDDRIGRTIAARAGAEGVDVSHVSFTPHGRTGLYFVELGEGTRASDVVYDRSGSSMACLGPGVIDWRAALSDASWFHVSGITAALSETAAAALAEALQIAKAAKLIISYDVNYRAKLWTPEQARQTQGPLLRYADVVITGEESARTVFGARGDSAEAVALDLQAQIGASAIVLTTRDAAETKHTQFRAMALSAKQVYRSRTFDVEVVDPIGAGDAFAAGLIFGRIRSGSWENALTCGAALATLKNQSPGDFCRCSIEDIGALVAKRA